MFLGLTAQSGEFSDGAFLWDRAAEFPKSGKRDHPGQINFSSPGKGSKLFLPKSQREGSMPVYDYICKDCQHSFELVLTLSEHDKDNIRCPKCESKNVEQDAAAFYAVTSKKS